MSDAVDAREAADALIVLYKNDYYLFASRSGGYWSSPDLRNWTLVVPSVLNVEGYAPSAFVMRDTLFFTHGWGSSSPYIYKSADPKSGVWIQGPSFRTYDDPNFFLDDDGKLYMYEGLSNSSTVPIVSVTELDPYTFEEIGAQVDLFYRNPSSRGWERRGDDNLLDEGPWLEGPWMTKKDNKYYLHYSGPGTEWKTYGEGIYTSDSPMGPYEYEPYSPFAFKPTGFISGAGHGGTFMDKDGNYWHIGTMTVSVNHIFERRLGLWPVSFDEDGQIWCNTDFGDYPLYNPGVVENHIDSSFAGMMLLSHKKFVTASSSLKDYDVTYATDEEVRTYWCALTGGPDEWMIMDLGKECSVEAVQVNFAEHNTTPELVRGRDNDVFIQYIIEKSSDGINWDTLIDKSENTKDVPHDYVEIENPVMTRYLKVKNVYTPGNGNFGIRDLRIFGNTDQAIFTEIDDFTVERDTADGRDAFISWSHTDDVDGYIIRYGIDTNKLYNNYMVYDADSIEIHSLNYGVDYFFSVTAFESGTDYYSPIGEIRSHQTGNWNDVDTWEKYDGFTWVHPSPNIPTLSDGSITILAGHTITVTESDSVDQFSIDTNATLIINKDIVFKVKNDIGTDMYVEGTVINYGTLEPETPATISFLNNGIYKHAQTSGSIPTANWMFNSSCVFDSIVSEVPDNGNQDFYNIIWNNPNQSVDVSFGWDGNTIGGNITIENTGTGGFQLCNPEAGNAVSVTVNGDIILNGGSLSAVSNNNANTNITINHRGNIIATGGNFYLSESNQGGNGKTSWNIEGNVSLTDVSVQNSNETGAKLIVSKDGGIQTISLSGVTYNAGGLSVEVANGASLDMGSSILQGNGNFHLKSGATLITPHSGGLDGSITCGKNIGKSSNFIYNGTIAQVTGTSVPDTVNAITINNSSGVTLSNPLFINGMLEIIDGTISSGGNEMVYGSSAALKYSGTSAQTTTSAEFPSGSGPSNLIIANSKDVTLHESRSVRWLELQNKFEIGNNTITVDSVSMNGTKGFVVTSDGGALKINDVGSTKVLFPIGANLYTPAWITNNGTVDGISIGVISDENANSMGRSVKVLWNIDEDTPGGGDYILQLGWPTTYETKEFKTDRENNAKIINLADTTEVGSGDYAFQFSESPYTVSRGGISELGTFGVGLFDQPTNIYKFENQLNEGNILHQNYPNPFATSTVINFEIVEKSNVSIKVFDMLGHEIFNLIDSEIAAGKHSVVFESSHLSEGIYYYTIATNGFVQTKRMSKIK